jgi:hypothetical protein
MRNRCVSGAIANAYVEFDEDGEAWPRPMGNVVAFGRAALIPPEVLETPRRQFGVLHGMLDIAVAKVGL